MLQLWTLVRDHGGGQDGAEGAGGPRVGDGGQEVTWQRVQRPRHFRWLDRIQKGTWETVTEAGVVLDQLLQGHHVGPLVNEEVDALLLNLKMMPLPIPDHAQDIELEFLAAVSDQKGAILVARLLLHQFQCFLPVNVGMVPLSAGGVVEHWRILVNERGDLGMTGSSGQVGRCLILLSPRSQG